jgi:SAM-dependent methyltransferase
MNQDVSNFSVWTQPRQVAFFAAAKGWIDATEEVLIERVRRDHAGGDVLDIGVGGGRTVPLVQPWAGRYVGIDVLPELVAVARQRYPEADLRVGDVRHLDFEDAVFDVAVFSVNGLDAMSHEDRGTALREIRRVLRPTGTFVFSTNNAEGPGPSERPWSLPPMSVRQPRSSLRTLTRRILHFRDALANYRRLQPLTSRGPGWIVTSNGADDFSLVLHYTTAEALQAELRDAGFAGDIELWDDRAGLRAGETRPQRRWWYFNVLVRCQPRERLGDT